MAEYIKTLDWQWQLAFWAAIAVVFVLITWGLTRISRFFFRKAQKKKRVLHLAFLERLTTLFIVVACIIIAVSAFSGARSVWQTLLGGTAIISAVLAFAAQDVIKDILAGFMISVNKPFGIGSRIVLENGTAGIVEDMTMRHVVIRGIDSLRYVIPNSRINAMQIENFSYCRSDRAIQFRFPVGYDSDVGLAKRVIAEAVEQSPHTIPTVEGADGERVYAPPYFIDLADSALIIAITVYYERSSPTEVVKDDVNTRVRAALIANDIEIPYNYVSIVDQTKREEK